jgi:ABC-type iron transport system FetAB ATPase subunit
MMTGQILGGTSVMQAARYQILIMYFIALCSFGTLLMEMYLTLRVCFDSRTILHTDLLKRRDKKPTFLLMMSSILQNICGAFTFKTRRSDRQSSLAQASDELMHLAPKGRLSISTSSHAQKNGKAPVISVEKLSYGFETRNDEEGAEPMGHGDANSTFRILFENLSFDMFAGGTGLVSGPSGVGKSTLLRVLAGLTSADATKIALNGKTQESYTNVALWRKQVRYVPQTKVDIPGTPNDFMSMIVSFKSWKTNIGGETPSFSDMAKTTRELLRTWAMNPTILDSEWKILSGGESQRVLVALSLASLPRGGVILLDESTSALDIETKLKVENSVEEYCAKNLIVAIWISHDPGQQDRMKQK